MAFQALPNGALAVIETGNASIQWTNTLWFTKASFTETDQQALATYVKTWYNDNIMTQLSAAYTSRITTVYDMRTETGPIKIAQVADDGGSKGLNPAALNAAVVATFYSAARGKSGRGRNYIAGFDEADTAATEVTSAVAVSIEAAYNTLITGVLAATGFTWVIASRQQGGVILPQIVPYDVISALVRSQTFGSQRRRVARS